MIARFTALLPYTVLLRQDQSLQPYEFAFDPYTIKVYPSVPFMGWPLPSDDVWVAREAVTAHAERDKPWLTDFESLGNKFKELEVMPSTPSLAKGFYQRFLDADDRVVFLESLINSTSITKEFWSVSLSAFANTRGGVLRGGADRSDLR